MGRRGMYVRQAAQKAVEQKQHPDYIEQSESIEAARPSQPGDQECKTGHESATSFLSDGDANQNTASFKKQASEQAQ